MYITKNVNNTEKVKCKAYYFIYLYIKIRESHMPIFPDSGHIFKIITPLRSSFRSAPTLWTSDTALHKIASPSPSMMT